MSNSGPTSSQMIRAMRTGAKRPGMLMRLAHQLLGFVFLLLGCLLGPLPIPLGVPCFLIGLALLAPYFKPVQKLVRWLRRKFPSLNKAMVKYRDKAPAFAREAVDATAPDCG